MSPPELEGGAEGESEVIVAVVGGLSLNGVLVVVVLVFKGVPTEGAGGGFEGVFVAEGVGVDVGLGVGNVRFSLISPYSFQSSTSSRSYQSPSGFL